MSCEQLKMKDHEIAGLVRTMGRTTRFWFETSNRWSETTDRWSRTTRLGRLASGINPNFSA